MDSPSFSLYQSPGHAPKYSLAPTGGEGWGEGANAGQTFNALTRLSPSGRATLSRGAGEGF